MKLPIDKLTATDRRWAMCACCNQRVSRTPAAWIGRASFRAPAPCVCLDCLRAAVELLERSPGACEAVHRRSGIRCASTGLHTGNHYAQTEDGRMVTWTEKAVR